MLGVKPNDLGSGCSFSLALFSFIVIPPVYYHTLHIFTVSHHVYCIFLSFFLLGYIGCHLNSPRQLQSMELLSMLYCYIQSPGYHAYAGKITKAL